MLDIARFVLVALVVVPLSTLNLVTVEEAKTIIPPPPFGVISELVEVAHLELPPPLVVGQVVRQVSDERQMVAKVPEVEKRLVVVAWVPVALTKVKFCRVEEPVRRRVERVVSPPVAVRVPVKLAAEEIV